MSAAPDSMNFKTRRKQLMHRLNIILCIVAALSPAAAWAGDEELDVEVGVTSGGQLAFPAFDFGVVSLDPVDPGNPFGLIGYSGQDPGWAAEGAPEGLLALADGAEVYVQILSISPALRMLDPNAGLVDIPAGSSWRLGGPEFDGHPLWLIDRTHPAYDPDAGPWVVTWRLVDQGATQYSPSENGAFSFVPEPNTLMPLALLTPALLYRREARAGKVNR
jgi:hypothetical protein